jgi:hypothetical protein
VRTGTARSQAAATVLMCNSQGQLGGGVRHCQSTLSTSGSSHPSCRSPGHIQTAHLKQHKQSCSPHSVPLMPVCMTCSCFPLVTLASTKESWSSAESFFQLGGVLKRSAPPQLWWRCGCQPLGRLSVVSSMVQKGGSWGQVQFQISSREVTRVWRLGAMPATEDRSARKKVCHCCPRPFGVFSC